MQNSQFSILNSQYSIKLRAVEPEDADFMYQVEEDPDAWKYSDYVAPLSREMLRQYAITYDADPLRSQQLRLIVEREGIAIGVADLFDISARHLRADSGIYLAPEYRGKSIGCKVLSILADYCKVRLGLHQMTATVSELNIAAKRCYLKAGFKETGFRPDWIRTPDSYESTILFSLVL